MGSIKRFGEHQPGAIAALFRDNARIIDWVKAQPLAAVLTCLGDGHDSIWNIRYLRKCSNLCLEIL
ncbi:hypothetical protein H6F61_13205 [Cyanobacteria bacterium FACHB-472]|nr:hypothetical protein [Cyanobacteria bacterium FACHB-472]